ncbi:MAG: hypothetical protein WBM86_30200 [Waterburya sp.]
MNILTICPCCSTPMLHHFGNHREYWFCRSCWQEMPDLENTREKRYQQPQKLLNLSRGFKTLVNHY